MTSARSDKKHSRRMQRRSSWRSYSSPRRTSRRTTILAQKMRKKWSMDEPNPKALTEVVHNVFDIEVNEKSVEDFKYCTRS